MISTYPSVILGTPRAQTYAKPRQYKEYPASPQ
jgi:hypothetical protein